MLSGTEKERRSAAGRGPAEKYDLLTALLAMGQHQAGAVARLAPRLALLVTARFNWRTERLAVGLREIARLWNVTERTAKREMAALRAMGWIACARPAARGRVAEHSLNVGRILAASRSVWPAIGPDFAARMVAPDGERAGQGGCATVLTFPAGTTFAPSEEAASPWTRASAMLREADPALHAAWFSKLTSVTSESGCVVLAAPSAFVAGYVETHHRAPHPRCAGRARPWHPRRPIEGSMSPQVAPRGSRDRPSMGAETRFSLHRGPAVKAHRAAVGRRCAPALGRGGAGEPAELIRRGMAL